MNKKTKLIYVLGSVVIGALAVLCVYFVLFATGVITAQKPKIVIATSASTKEYDGTVLSNANWQIVSGELKNGHKVEVTVSGQQTEIGTSSNLFSVKIVNDKGRDVTDDYAVEYKPGELAVTKRKLEVTVEDEEKVYDGTPLLPQTENITKGSLLEGHVLDTVLNGEITDAGTEEAGATCTVTDALGEDVTSLYEISVIKGELKVEPLPIVIQTGSAYKPYDGTPLTNDSFEIVSITKPLDGHVVEVSVIGSITEQGEAENAVAQTVIKDAYGNVVTDNYEISYELGKLVVQGILPIGGGGGGGGGLDKSGIIGGCGGGGAPGPAFNIYSDVRDVVYLRSFSYTDFNGKTWSNPTDGYPELIDGVYCANYLAGIALENAGISKANVEIEMLTYDYLLSHFTARGEYGYDIQTNDVLNQGDFSTVYSFAYYPFNYVNQSSILEQASIDGYEEYEEAYREYVYGRYLNVPLSSSVYLQGVIEENGFEKDDEDIIAKVAYYIQNAAVYNKEYNTEMDNAEDILVAFLSEYREGICQHYALAATMLFRELGIPARHTIGYTATTVPNEWVEVTTANAHSWVEVYIDGVGWVNVEVTGRERERIPNLGEFTIRVKSKYVNVADQDVINASELDYELEGFDVFEAQGYTCEVVLKGRQVGVGKTLAELDYATVIDPDGYDVTLQFTIDFKPGYMSVYQKKITIVSGSADKPYDGTPLTCDDYTIIDGELIVGHNIVITPIGSITAVGETRNVVSISIQDTYGNDVSDMYYVIPVMGTLTVYPQLITIVAGSDTKEHDGTPLTCNEYVLYDSLGNQIDSLGEGITITVSIEGSIIECGRCDNVITSVVIKNALGEDITSYYQIAKENGQLRVIMPNP